MQLCNCNHNFGGGAACLFIRGKVLYFEMGIFTYWQGSIYMMMQLLMMNLVVWLGWLSAIALAQVELSETVTGTVNLTNVGIACLGNLDFFSQVW